MWNIEKPLSEPWLEPAGHSGAGQAPQLVARLGEARTVLLSTLPVRHR